MLRVVGEKPGESHPRAQIQCPWTPGWGWGMGRGWSSPPVSYFHWVPPGVGTVCLAVSLLSLLCFGPHSGAFLPSSWVSVLSPPLTSLSLLSFSVVLPYFPPPVVPPSSSSSLSNPPLQFIFLPFFPHCFLCTTSFLLPTPRPPGNWRETRHYPAEVSPHPEPLGLTPSYPITPH